jgi:hypothetical protein
MTKGAGSGALSVLWQIILWLYPSIQTLLVHKIRNSHFAQNHRRVAKKNTLDGPASPCQVRLCIAIKR